jgi:DNA-directed RNA polymerase specialized sigma24 family protein
LHELPAGVDDTGTPYELCEKHLLVRQALAQVYARCDEKTRVIFEGVVLESRSPAEVAAANGVSVGRVHTVKSQMLRRLRQRFAGLVDWDKDLLPRTPRRADEA